MQLNKSGKQNKTKYKMELDEIRRKIERANQKSDELKQQIEEIETLVSTKKEEYTLKEYLDNKVIERLHELFNENEQEFEANLERVEDSIQVEEEKLMLMKGTNRLKVILDDFNACLGAYSKELGSSLNKNKIHSLGEKIQGSGSSHPKETLAYFFTYLTIMHKYSTPIMMPVVIDEFKQNGTTDQSIDKMIEFAINHRPKNGQVIYSISGDYSATGLNVKTVSLDGESLMNECDFSSVKSEVEHILNKNFRLK